jgi:hypothetical protein
VLIAKGIHSKLFCKEKIAHSRERLVEHILQGVEAVRQIRLGFFDQEKLFAFAK